MVKILELCVLAAMTPILTFLILRWVETPSQTDLRRIGQAMSASNSFRYPDWLRRLLGIPTYGSYLTWYQRMVRRLVRLWTKISRY